MTSPLPASKRVDEYCRRAGISRIDRLGEGKDGAVWRTDHPSAVKIHEAGKSYRVEIATYIRFLDLGMDNIAGFTIPKLVGCDDELFAIAGLPRP
jgi:hypothetical protein